MKKVLNVGGGSHQTPIPPLYDGWEHLILDIDPSGHPDLVCDARELLQFPSSEYDAIYCSHNLEHYYRHDVIHVLAGFRHVLKDDGFVHIHVPDLGQVMQAVVQQGLDIDDVLFESQLLRAPITVRDVIYGYGVEIEKSGVDFWAHKTGFTRKSLETILTRCGFPYVYLGTPPLEVVAIAFKNKPTEFAMNLLNFRVE